MPLGNNPYNEIIQRYERLTKKKGSTTSLDKIRIEQWLLFQKYVKNITAEDDNSFTYETLIAKYGKHQVEQIKDSMKHKKTKKKDLSIYAKRLRGKEENANQEG